MRSSRTITLFSDGQEIGQRSSSILFSILFHCLGVGLVFFGALYSPHLDTRVIAQRYTVRRLDLDMPDFQVPRPAPSKANYHPKPVEHPSPSTGKPTVQRQTTRAPKGAQTLIQPDLPKQLAMIDEVPVPTLMIWTPNKIVVKTIVAPPPAKPTAANVTPSPAPPIQEMNLADISIATSNLPHPKLPSLPSTTSPLRTDGPEVQMAPSSISQVTAKPTAAAVMSLSSVQMTKGSVVLPPVNESAASDSQGPLAAGEAQNSAPGNSSHDGNGGAGDHAGNGMNAPGNAVAQTNGEGNNSSLLQGSGNNSGNRVTATKITLPKDGQFGAVVVGASLQEQFPQMMRVWTGKLAYTVYLHVGLARSWILQYSLPFAEDAAAGGTVAHLDAPWPYNIVRPNLGADQADAEAIMVHGYVNQSGKFEGLRIVFPPQCPQTQFVLASLQQWQFRPAARDGQLARVEVLLIIPEEF
jgi:hypothetical protein